MDFVHLLKYTFERFLLWKFQLPAASYYISTSFQKQISYLYLIKACLGKIFSRPILIASKTCFCVHMGTWQIDFINCESTLYFSVLLKETFGVAISPSYGSSNSQTRECNQCATMKTLSYTNLLRTISIGTPGFTIAIFIHSLPRSTDMTATVTANKDTVCYIKLVRQKSRLLATEDFSVLC